MKILVINAESGYGGGPAIIANGIAKAVCERGGEAVVAYGRQADPNSGVRVFDLRSKAGLYSHIAVSRLFDAHGFGSSAATKKLLAFMDEFKPDLVNLHNIHGYYLNVELLFEYLTQKNIPIVGTLHDCWAFTGHCAYFDRVGCDKWQTGCKSCPQSHGYPKSLVLDRSEANFARKKALFTAPRRMTVVTPSDWLRELAEKSFLGKYPCKTIHNGIDLQKYHPIESDWKKQHGLEDKKMLLGVAATWGGARKGLQDLIKIASSLGEAYKLVIVGLTPKQLETLPDNVLGICRTENVEELVKIYTAADVFVNASIEDNFPTVILEALACGTPVVTYDTGGSRESLNEVCGRVVEQKNTAQFADAVRDVLQSGDLKQACLERIADFNHKKKYGEYADLFSEMTGK